MAKKENRVSITKLDEYLKAQNRDDVVHFELPFGDGKKLEFDVKRRLSIGEFYAAIQGIVDNTFVYNEDTGLTEYSAAQEHASAITYVLTMVANFKPETATDKLVALYEVPEIHDAIVNTWEQMFTFDATLQKQIEWRQKELLSAERNLLKAASDKLSSATDALGEIASAFDGVDPSAMMDIMQKVVNMNEFEIGRGVLAAQPAELSVVK